MKNFAEYYKNLLEWEGVEFQELISTWKENLIQEVQDDFQLDERIEKLEEKVESLENELNEFRQKFEEFKKQFE